MKLFLDTASLDDIERLQPFGVVDGVTTNPALLARTGRDPLAQLREIAARVPGPVSAQVTRRDARSMVEQGRALAGLAPNVVVKVPASREGYGAARALTEAGIDCNVTLAFEPAQAVLFARIPVAYVSLIVGRIEDFGGSGLRGIRAAARLFEALASPSRLLVASIRNPGHLRAAIEGGAHVVTVPPSTWDLVLDHPLTRAGEDDFRNAWGALPEAQRRGYDDLAAPANGRAGGRGANGADDEAARP